MNEIIEYAPCKVNLFLDVVGKRPDGYHGIESIMAALPLCDKVAVKKTEVGISVSFSGGDALTEELSSLSAENNLAYRAAVEFLKRAGIDSGVEIIIEKNIPSKAGLGGGSADAAAVLRALNKMFSYPFSEEELCSAALSLGADVPFCVCGGTALCRGIGEEITKIDNKTEFHGVITSEHAEKKSTADAYRAVDALMCSHKTKKSAVRMAKALEAGAFDAVCGEAFNVFGTACGYPDGARRLLDSLGAPFVLMSGAGPSVVALTTDRASAEALGRELEKNNYNAFIF